MRRTTGVTLLALVVLLAACGSTNKKPAKRAGGATLAPEASAVTDVIPTDSPTPGPSGPAGTKKKGSTSTGTGKKTSAPVTGAATLPNVTPKPVALGKGVIDNKVFLAFHTSKNLDTGFTAVGASADNQAGSTNERPMVDALVNWLNKNGGITGRQVVSVVHEYDAIADGSWEQQATQACAKFTQDFTVVAALTSHVGGSDALQNCLAARKVPVVQQNQWPYEAKDYNGFLYQPSRMRQERWAPVYIKGLKDAGYFSSGARVGLLRFSGQLFDRLADRYDKAFQDLGLPPIASRFTVTTPAGTSDFGRMGGELGSAIVQFTADTVTHVIFAEYGSIIPFFFTTQAEQAGFRPRYGASSVNLPATMASQNPEAQLAARGGAVAISWVPGQDVRRQQDPRTNANLVLCKKIMTDAGITPQHLLYTGLNCENVFFAKAALEKTSEVSQAGFKEGAEALGTSFDSPFGWPQTTFGPGRYDGAGLVRTAVYKGAAACGKCFEYLPGEKTIP